MVYCRWEDLVSEQGQSQLLIAELDPDEPLPASRTHLAALRALIVGLVPVGDFALRAEGASAVHIAFEKSADAARIATLIGANTARNTDGGSTATFKYNFRTANKMVAALRLQP